MTKGIFITVRTGSTRLPNKALRTICGKKTIEFCIERAKKSNKTNKIILCTSAMDEDRVLCEIAKAHHIDFFQGSLEDKLDRWLKAALQYNIDYFVNIDGDDLFCEPELIDLAFEQYERELHDFVRIDEKNMICGAFTFGVKTDTIKKVCELKNTNDTEAAWLTLSSMKMFKTKLLKNVPKEYNRPEIRATLDYEEDLKFFTTISEYFYNMGNYNFSLMDVIRLIDEQPEIALINRHKHQDYLDNQNKLNKRLI